MSLLIRSLSVRPEWVDPLAEWHYAEWGALYGPEWSLSAARDELRAHSAGDRFPLTLVAERDGELLGSVSLVEHDAMELEHFGSPWLASLYVRAEMRGCGVGRRLIEAVQQCAAAQRVARLRLFTPAHSEYYRRGGWRKLRRAQVNGQSVDVMIIDLGAASLP